MGDNSHSPVVWFIMRLWRELSPFCCNHVFCRYECLNSGIRNYSVLSNKLIRVFCSSKFIYLLSVFVLSEPTAAGLAGKLP